MTSVMARTSTSKAKSPPTERPPASSEAVKRRMKRTKRRDTPSELALRKNLREAGLRYRVDWQLPQTRRRADVAFPALRLAVFVDGCFWHGCPDHGTWPKTNASWWRAKLLRNVERDRATDHYLRALGWRVLRFWAHEDMARAARTITLIVLKKPRRASRRARDLH
jgi:DNA mismatch endonuclease (patch repair protein)